MVRRAFDLLGIEVTKDTRVIKKAYAALTKQCHPEEQPAEWEKLYEAYQTALEYARSAEELQEETSDAGDPDAGSYSEVTVSSDALYGEMFEEAQKQWAQEKTIDELILRQRINELAALSGRKAVRGWRQFFAQEFTLAKKENALLLLFQEIAEGHFSEKVLKLILETMNGRIRDYVEREEVGCARLSAQIVEYCAKQVSSLHIKNERRRKIIWIPGALAVMFIILGMIGLRKEQAEEEDLSGLAAAYLNEKYGGTSYTTENLESKKENVIGDFVNKMDFYEIRSVESGAVIVYAMRGEHDKEGEYALFDNLQEEEIREAFQEVVNTASGHEEGRLFWDSSTADPLYGGIEDGYFHTKYEGDFADFILHEAARRADTPTGDPKVLAAEYRSMNGSCDYYLPDPVIRTVRERFDLMETAADSGLQEVLDRCAEDYKVQIRCPILPADLFGERIAQAERNGYHVYVMEDVHEWAGLRPSMSFLLVTGWYVSLPPDDEKLLGVPNGMYMQPILSMGEGIYGAESSIGGKTFSGDPQWAAESIVRTETPESLELTEAERERAVSFRLADGCVLKNDYSLAIDKERYKIADTGYRVIVTKQESVEMDVADKHLESPVGFSYEKYVSSYRDAGTILYQGEVLDGGGYLYIEYEMAENAETADIITVINP